MGSSLTCSGASTVLGGSATGTSGGGSRKALLSSKEGNPANQRTKAN